MNIQGWRLLGGDGWFADQGGDEIGDICHGAVQQRGAFTTQAELYRRIVEVVVRGPRTGQRPGG